MAPSLGFRGQEEQRRSEQWQNRRRTRGSENSEITWLLWPDTTRAKYTASRLQFLSLSLSVCVLRNWRSLFVSVFRPSGASSAEAALSFELSWPSSVGARRLTLMGQLRAESGAAEHKKHGRHKGTRVCKIWSKMMIMMVIISYRSGARLLMELRPQCASVSRSFYAARSLILISSGPVAQADQDLGRPLAVSE